MADRDTASDTTRDTGHDTGRDTGREREMIRNLDEALAENPALTPQQFEDVRRLRAQVQGLCRSGKMDEAQDCQELAINIIREGAPASE